MKIDKIGKFQVVGSLGTGAHSTILHVRRRADSKNYALKVVPIGGSGDQKFLDQARHEFEIAQLLDHPNLIRIYVMECERDWFFRVRKVHLLIEYVNGKTLDTMPRLSVARLVQVFARVAAGLAHMHRRGVYHADLKPNNILLSRAGEVKVIDFGLAWRKGENKGRIQGTPEYMAPEQVQLRVVNEQTDIYNLGATMYRLVTWRHAPNPVADKSGISKSASSWDKLIKPVRDLAADAPDALCDLIHRCLSYEPGRRPERMSEVKEALELLEHQLVRAPEDKLEALEW